MPVTLLDRLALRAEAAGETWEVETAMGGGEVRTWRSITSIVRDRLMVVRTITRKEGEKGIETTNAMIHRDEAGEAAVDMIPTKINVSTTGIVMRGGE